jgi:type II secretory pathway predicted ATPase ExeA
MLLDYYNLCQQPFGVTPDPQFLYMSRTHSEALASLWCGLQEDRGFMALVAPPGMGKTTLLFQLLQHLQGRARTAFLFQTQCDSREMFAYLLRDLGVTPGPDLASMHDQLNQLLLEEARAGRRFVLVIDEAQDLALPVLETIRLLSDFETSRRKLLQIIIAGQLSLIGTLVRPDTEQLRQRISMLASLRTFNQQEVREYVECRLHLAGRGNGPPLFSNDALEMIAQGSGGIPRIINNICFNALSIGYALQKKRIGREEVEEALADRKIEALLPDEGTAAPLLKTQPACDVPKFRTPQQRPLGRVALIGVMAVMAAVLTLLMLGRGWWPQQADSDQQVTGKPAATIQQDIGQPLAALPARPLLPAPEGSVAKAIVPERNLVVVERQQTIADISKRYLGGYTPAAIAKLRALNPSLTNLDHIEAGQAIRLRADRASTTDAKVQSAEAPQSPRKQP